MLLWVTLAAGTAHRVRTLSPKQYFRQPPVLRIKMKLPTTQV